MKKLDGAGMAKMETLDGAQLQLQRIHGLVERMAIEVRGNRSTSSLRQQIARALPTLEGLLKPQFGLISDNVASMLLALTRGGGDQTRLRSLREAVGRTRSALEVAVVKVQELHAVDDGPRGRVGDHP